MKRGANNIKRDNRLFLLDNHALYQTVILSSLHPNCCTVTSVRSALSDHIPLPPSVNVGCLQQFDQTGFPVAASTTQPFSQPPQPHSGGGGFGDTPQQQQGFGFPEGDRGMSFTGGFPAQGLAPPSQQQQQQFPPRPQGFAQQGNAAPAGGDATGDSTQKAADAKVGFRQTVAECMGGKGIRAEGGVQ